MPGRPAAARGRAGEGALRLEVLRTVEAPPAPWRRYAPGEFTFRMRFGFAIGSDSTACSLLGAESSHLV